MDQLNVDDCPLSIVDGSAVKLLITGLSPLLLGVDLPLLFPPDGGGVAGRGVRGFLHPAATTTNASIRRIAPILEVFNLSFSRILNKLLSVNV